MRATGAVVVVLPAGTGAARVVRGRTGAARVVGVLGLVARAADVKAVVARGRAGPRNRHACAARVVGVLGLVARAADVAGVVAGRRADLGRCGGVAGQIDARARAPTSGECQSSPDRKRSEEGGEDRQKFHAVRLLHLVEHSSSRLENGWKSAGFGSLRVQRGFG